VIDRRYCYELVGSILSSQPMNSALSTAAEGSYEYSYSCCTQECSDRIQLYEDPRTNANCLSADVISLMT
jgi:hypothetical protein